MLVKALVDFKYDGNSIKKDQYFTLKDIKVDSDLIRDGLVEPVPQFEVEEQI